MEIAKDVVLNVLALLFFCVFSSAVIGVTWFNIQLSTALAGTLVVAAVFCALLGNPDRFQSLKFSLTGIEARAREVIQKAEVTQQAFQKLASMTGELLIELNAAQGRWDSGEGKLRDERKAGILSALTDIGLSGGDLAKVSSSDRTWNIVDYVGGITNFGAKKVPQDRNADWASAVAPMRGVSLSRMASTTPEELRDVFERFGILDDESNALIEDYRHYLRTGEQRRPETWAARYEW